MPIGGAVTLLSREAITGWVVDTEAESLPTVDIFVDGHKVRTIKPTSKMKGFEEFPCKGMAQFKFRVTPSFAQYIHTAQSLQFRVRDKVLPVVENKYRVIRADRRQPVEELVDRLKVGYIVTKTGKFRLSVHLDIEWQHKVLQFYARAREVFKSKYDLDLPIAYGTLLGHVRQGGFIPGDDDFDTTYVSRHTDTHAVKREMISIMRDLIGAGETVKLAKRKNFFHWADKDLGVTIDVFPAWCRGDMYFQSFAVGSEVAKEVAKGFTEETLCGMPVLVPVEKEKVLEGTYGSEWRTPDPMFQWVVKDPAAYEMAKLSLTKEEANEIYWDLNYKDLSVNPPSSFANAVQPKIDKRIKGLIDLGCGSGRDTTFVSGGLKALGLDYAHTAIVANRDRMSREGVTNVAFEQVDVRETEALTSIIKAFSKAAGGPIAVYSRFFLHSIDDAGEASVLRAIKDALPTGSSVFLEFRTHLDQHLTKTHGGHYRRFVNPDDFEKRVANLKVFEIVQRQEGQGLATYKDEDPHIARFELRKISRRPVKKTFWKTMRNKVGF
ncbi:hypothetical protein J2Y48_003146 [Mycoplana sp. BE70]|uniref:LicD family protein n=1 Tax=Mycoplana sp. BE70 TaxID=2817775 RepID=UPI0028650F1E|nr:LicD family protein [Mycoplana sp. BE70]MDR6757849.1 hypothetical protein [Mycoplana sp. BE70]